MVAPANATEDAPGTFRDKQQNTALQNHVSFFDRDEDGIIWPSDTMIALRELGFGLFWTVFGMMSIHLAFSWITWGTIIPDPFFRLKVNRMHKAKHGSDTEIYTTTGVFDDNRFNYMFDMYTQEPHMHMTLGEMFTMLQGDRNPYDPFGWVCAFFEWFPTYIMLNPEDGKMKREDVKAVYDVRTVFLLGFYVDMRRGVCLGVHFLEDWRTE
ncbi:Caleosin-domain-containing protein [Macrolepiota fuliginosa MF-IS2]|uniref:Caleosin-domain-containing protein n=1 Tax=Macrolepiota fuliginosa MF-IS2 TaxID=1400762 RepID=A0A9P5XDE6_9AGAR|nr:Caleosin-domain-containing protein [Macrolepiota fuliginosa MF-IS2]